MVELNFAKPLPRQVPAELMIYSTERASVSQTSIIKMFRKLRLPDIQNRPEIGPIPVRARLVIRPEFRYVDNWTIGKHISYTVAMNRRSGAIRFRDETRHGSELDVPFRISERRSTDISREFIDRTGLLKTPARDLKVGKITHLRTQGASIDGEVAPEQILDAGVIFTRQIDGVPVVGTGGHIMVNVAAHESVVGSVKIWRHRADSLGMVRVLKPDYAIKQLESRLDRRGLRGRVNVIKADFCYFEAGDNKTQKYLEPAYAFVFETKVDQFLYKSVEVIPATRQPKHRWSFRKRFRATAVVRED